MQTRNDFDTQKAITSGKSAIASGVNTVKKKLGVAPPPVPPPPPPKPKKRAIVGNAIKKVGSGAGRVAGAVGKGIASGGKAIGRELKARSIAKRAAAADDNFIKHATEFQAKRHEARKAGTTFGNAKRNALKGKVIARVTPEMQSSGEDRRYAKAQAKIHKNAMKSIKQSHLEAARRSLRGDSSPLLREDGPRTKVGGRCGKGWQDGPGGKCVRAERSGLTYGQRGKGIGGTAKWAGKNILLGSGDVEYNRRRSLGQGRGKAALHGALSGSKGGIQNLALGGPAGGSVYRRSRNVGQGRLRSGAKGLATNLAVNTAIGAAAIGISRAAGGGKNRGQVGESEPLTTSEAPDQLPGGDRQPKKRSGTIMMKPRPEAAAGREVLGRIAVKKILDKSAEAAAAKPSRKSRKPKPRGDSFEYEMRWKARVI
jgi:hypothetical protein